MLDYPMPMPMKLEGIRCQRHICWWGSNARYHLSAVDEVEDEISDPDEDSLAGQMAVVPSRSVKRVMTRIAWISSDSD